MYVMESFLDFKPHQFTSYKIISIVTECSLILLKTLEIEAKSCDSYIAKFCGLCRWPLEKIPPCSVVTHYKNPKVCRSHQYRTPEAYRALLQ